MFNYKTIEDFKAKCEELGVNIPVGNDKKVLREEIKIGNVVVPNRVAVQPMEGCDGTTDGHPGELTIKRYDKFAKSGAGLLWEEATAIVPEGRANPRQVMINKDTVDSFKRLNESIREQSIKENGFAPIIIMQATHSGRYSKPNGKLEPLIAYNNPIFEGDNPFPKSCIVSDDYIKSLEVKMGEATVLAQEAGFDGIDVKSCHRYLGSELLSAYNREGEYGGSFDNRTRFLRNGVANAMANAKGDFIVTSRLNIYDGFPYPYGFGVNETDGTTPDLTEAKKLVGILHKDLGMKLLDITIGNPYFNPHVNRPSDIQPYALTEDPLIGMARMLNCTKAIQELYPELVVMGSGLTYPRQYSDIVAAEAINKGYFQIAGFGRMSFAYPDFAKVMTSDEPMDSKKICVTCGKCSLLMRYGSTAGCVIRDPFYRDLFKEVSKGQTPVVGVK